MRMPLFGYTIGTVSGSPFRVRDRQSAAASSGDAIGSRRREICEVSARSLRSVCVGPSRRLQAICAASAWDGVCVGRRLPGVYERSARTIRCLCEGYTLPHFRKNKDKRHRPETVCIIFKKVKN